MRKELLSFSPPLIGEEEISEVIDTLRSDWITTGPKTKLFERQFAAAVGAPSALAVNSCTAALHIALATLGVGPGDVVITTPLTFCSTAHVIEQVGARPVFVDVEPDTLNLDVSKAKETILRLHRDAQYRVRAILPVHLYGHSCDMDRLLELASEFNLAVIEDAAHALPAKYKGRMIGSMASTSQVPLFTCFSFYATKNLTTGEGGMLTGPPELVEDARIWSLHGMSRDAWKRYGSEGSWYYEVVRPGFKYNMMDIQAAIGLHQLRKLPEFHARRREIVQKYNSAFSSFRQFQIPIEKKNVEHAWHIYVLRLNAEFIGISRNQFIDELRARDIASSVHFIPLHLQPYYRDKYRYQRRDFPVAYREYNRMLSLPLFAGMSDQDVDDVVEAVVAIADQYAIGARAARSA